MVEYTALTGWGSRVEKVKKMKSHNQKSNASVNYNGTLADGSNQTGDVQSTIGVLADWANLTKVDAQSTGGVDRVNST